LPLVAQAVETRQIFSRQKLGIWNAKVEKINLCGAAQKFEMQVGPGGVARLPDISDNLSRLDGLPSVKMRRKSRKMRVA